MEKYLHGYRIYFLTAMFHTRPEEDNTWVVMYKKNRLLELQLGR
jgi:hypothetical protein